MAKVSVRIRSRLNEATREQLKKYEDSAKRIVFQGSALVRNTAVESIMKGAKSGVVYTKYNPKRVHKSSAAGEPPASDTGYLVSNIFQNIDSGGMGASVESRANYSAYLEFGTTKMAARPFLQRALDENRPAIRRLYEKMKV